MPLMQCTRDGEKGWKYGESGTCYTGPDARAKAEAQGRAIEANKADTMTEYREDLGGSIEACLDDNGYLRIDGVAAKAGVLTYLLPDGNIRREYVPAETLFNADSLATLTGSPVTVDHPGVLNADNAAQYSRGSVPKAEADGDKLRVGLVITAKEAIEAIDGGKKQLSPGYRTELDFTPGEYDGVRYDAVQVKRVYNHMAVVSGARGGPECRLNLDGVNCAVEVPDGTTTTQTTNEVTSMATVKLKSGATVEVADASTASTIQAEINQLGQRADAADGMVEKAKFDELQGKYDALKEEADKLKEADTKMDSNEIGAYVETVEKAKRLKSDIEIKQDGKYLDATAVMAKALGIDPEGKSPEYVKGRFDAALDMQRDDSVANQRQPGNGPDLKEVPKTGREKFIEEQQKRGA